MRWEEVVRRFRECPLIDPAMLSVGLAESPARVQVQLSRWVRSGKLLQLRRGLYILPDSFRLCSLPPGLVANYLVRPSYVSFQSVLSRYDLIPEAVPVTTSVTTRRPIELETPLGRFTYRHLKRELFWGYEAAPESGHQVVAALPEKALLDLIYIRRRAFDRAVAESWRLQNVEDLNFGRLTDFASRFRSPRIRAAAGVIAELARETAERSRRP